MVAATARSAQIRDLLQALDTTALPPSCLSSPSRERQKVASLVVSTWEDSGREPAGIASKFFDGALAALEDYVAEASPGPSEKEGSLPSHRPAHSEQPAPATAAATPAEPPAGPCTGGPPGGAPHAGWVGEGGGEVPRVHSSGLSYADFVLRFMQPNLPVVVQGIGQGWRAFREWVTPEGRVNLAFMEDRFGAATASVHSCGGGPVRTMSVREYCAWWREHAAARDTGASNGPLGGGKHAEDDENSSSGGAAAEPGGAGLLYLKDWHFVQDFPDYQAYETPAYFRDDWLNHYMDCCRELGEADRAPSGQDGGVAGGEPPGGTPQGLGCGGDYRFGYLGPRGTTTPVHTDVLRSFSWSINVAGRKRWHLLPPCHAHLLYDRFGREPAPGFFLGPAAAHAFPGLAQARRHLLTCDQGPGEAIFVPAGWFHSVENAADTLSINHNWTNACGLAEGWWHLAEERAACAAAIADCREASGAAGFEALVERMLRASAGMATADFLGFVVTELHALLARCSAGRQQQQQQESQRQQQQQQRQQWDDGNRDSAVAADRETEKEGPVLNETRRTAKASEALGVSTTCRTSSGREEHAMGLGYAAQDTSGREDCDDDVASREELGRSPGPTPCEGCCSAVLDAYGVHSASLVLRAVTAELQRQLGVAGEDLTKAAARRPASNCSNLSGGEWAGRTAEAVCRLFAGSTLQERVGLALQLLERAEGCLGQARTRLSVLRCRGGMCCTVASAGAGRNTAD